MRWGPISEKVKTRTSKQCRERWINHLSPEVCKSAWQPEEDEILLNLENKYKRKWAFIAKHLPGRSQNQVKVRWKSLKRVNNRLKSSGKKLNISYRPSDTAFSFERKCTQPYTQTQGTDDDVCDCCLSSYLDLEFENSVLELLLNI